MNLQCQGRPGVNTMSTISIEGIVRQMENHVEAQQLKKESNPKDLAASDRLDLTLFPDTAVVYGALAMSEGSMKYGGFNYREKGIRISVYIAAVRRHLTKYYNGEWEDKKTKVPHLGSAIAGLAIIVDSVEMGKAIDDRPPALTGMSSLIDDECRNILSHLSELFPDKEPRVTHKQEEETNDGTDYQ